MKAKKRILTISIILCLLLALAPSALADPIITFGNLDDATYLVGETAEPLDVGLALIGTTFQWQSAPDGTFVLFLDIPGATEGSYTPSTANAGTRLYRCKKTNGGDISYTDAVKITVLNEPTVSLTPLSQSVPVGGQATFTAAASGTDGWVLTHSYWAWGPTANPADIAGDTSSGGSIAMTTISKTLTAPGAIYYFYVAEYTDEANGTKDITVYSNGAQAVVSSTNPFTDISPSDWFYSDVLYAYNLGLVSGMTPTTYEPNGYLTIAQAIKLAACMHQYDNTGSVTLANGVVNWYDTYVDYAIANGIISSSSYAGRYDSNATRAEYVKIFYYALPPADYTENHTVPAGSIPDVAITDPYGYEVYTFYRAGILQGNDANGTFAPGSNIKRSEVAAIIARMMEPANRITAPYPWV